MDFLEIEKKIEAFIADKVRTSGSNGVVLGLSGGIDSSVVATLAARALGSENVKGLIMPSHSGKKSDIDDARELAAKLGISYEIIPIHGILKAFLEHLVRDKKAEGNLMARIRMCLLYYKANRLNYLVAGTGNRSELSVGYFTKYGDGGCDILPIGALLKTEVYELARYLSIPQKIIDKKPSAGLWPGQTDEGELGISYSELDAILSGSGDGLLSGKATAHFSLGRMINSSEHKRRPPDICKL